MKFSISKKLFRIILLLIFCNLPTNLSLAQIDPDFLWVNNYGGLDDDSANDIAIDGAGNIIVTGSFQGSMTVGSTTLNSFGLDDIFIAKFDPLGNVLWAIRAGGADYDEGFSVTTDNNNNIIVTGSFSGDAFFGSTVLTSSGSTDVFIAKYTSSGVLLWAKKGGGNSFDAGYGVAADNSGAIYVTGVFSRIIQFDQLSVQGGEYFSIFLVKYDANGNALWLNAGISNGFYNFGYGIATNSLNDVFITGMFGEVTNFSGTVLTSVAGPDVFLARYNSSGNLIWVKQAGGNSFNESGYDIAIDSNNDIYLVGGFSETINFGGIPPITATSSSNAFVAKYNLAGNTQWAVIAGVSDYTFGQGIALDKLGNIFVSGTVSQFGFKRGEQDKVYFAKLRNNGQLIWEFSAGNENINSSGGIVVNDNGEAYVSGGFYASGLFGSTQLTSNGFRDVFVGKLPAPRLNLVNSNINFGSVAVGSNSNRTVQISNPSTTRLNIYNIILAGPNANEFSITGSLQNIAPQQTANLNLTFTPASAGQKNAILIIESDATTTPDTVFLTGTGGNLSLTLSTNTLNFGTLEVNESAELILTLSNTGTQPIIINDIQISGSNQNEFGLIGQLQDTIPVTQSRNIRVIYTPSSVGSKFAQLSVLSNAPSSPDFVSLIGNAVPANITISFSSRAINFGNVDVNTFAERILTVTNTSTQTVYISDIFVPEPADDEFGALVLQDSIPPSGILNVRVFFFPASAGEKSAFLIFESNALSSPDTILLTGNAVSSIIVQQPQSVPLGQTTSLNVLPPPGFTVVSNQFYFRRTGESEFQQSTMNLSGEIFIANIPPAFSTVRGIQYFIEFFDGEQTVTFPSENPSINPASLQVNIERLNFPELINPSVYRMVSAPMILNNPSLSAVLTDDFGNYDTLTWRLFNWNPSTEQYVEFPNLTKDFSPGNAFWLIHRTGKIFDFENGLSVPSISNVNISIQPGWNQIANPFAFPIDWAVIDVPSEIQPPVRWIPDSLDYEYNQSILEPWEGYWLFNPLSQSVNLSFPPIERSGDKPVRKISDYLNQVEFLIQIKTTLENAVNRDNQNFVGMLKSGNTLHNKNLLEAPPISNEIRLSIIEHNNRFAQYLIERNNEGGMWNLKLSTSHKNKNVTLYFDELKNIPSTFNLYLLNTDKQIAIPIVDRIAVIKMESPEDINLQLIIGTEEYAKQKAGNITLIPTEYALYQNYPNPFNPATTIEYNLREKSIVSLEVYDLLGRKIATLLSSDIQNAGRQSVSWDGKNLAGEFVSSGVYIYQLRANDFSESKKMMLIR